MTPTPLQGRFSAVATKVRADFEESVHTKHRGSRGAEREEIVARFLRLYLPQTVEVIHNAEIISAEGGVSPQCDILIVDRSTPQLTDSKTHRIVPAECVYGVVEVKSQMNSKEAIDGCEKIAKVKRLARTAYVVQRKAPMDFSGPRYPPHPFFGYVFAFEGIKLETIEKRVFDWCKANPRVEHPDGLWVADSGMLVWGPGKQEIRPSGVSWHPGISHPQLDRSLMVLTSANDPSWATLVRTGEMLVAITSRVLHATQNSLPSGSTITTWPRCSP
jgi:hypothetical protein